jgi:hypothetical protein
MGLQALRAGDRKYVVPNDTRKLAGSVNVDDALRQRYPNDPRWDYGVAYKRRENHADHVHWIEVHPARTDVHRNEVRAKLHWIKTWLMNDGARFGKFSRDFVWISSGEAAFTSTSPQLRVLAEDGLRFSGRRLVIR